jgi:predicted acyl esterase
MAQGWLRASHRRLDPSASLPYRPFHSHTDVEPLEPGEIYQLDVEIWPTSIIIPAGYRMALTVRGNDYRYEGELDDFARSFHYAGRGIGPFRHDDPTDRPADLSGGVVTLHVGGDTPSHLLVPVVPPKPG